MVTLIDSGAFYPGYELISASFGTNFTEPTEIKFGDAVFNEGAPFSVDLVLGENVLPKPDMEFRSWQDYGVGSSFLYRWKSITIYLGIENKVGINIYSISNNVYYINNEYISDLELFDVMGNRIKKYDNYTKFIDLNDFSVGIYLLQYTENNQTKIIKLIKK